MSEKRLATILLVEDEASDADLICRGFAKAKVRRIPVVVLTSDRESATMDAAYDLGANSYLVKPGNPTEIVRIVETIQRYWIDLNEPPQLVIKCEDLTPVHKVRLVRFLTLAPVHR